MKKFFTLIAMMFATSAAMFAQDDVEWGPNLFENSDLEAEAEYPWFHVKSNFENPEGAITTAIPEAGVGVEGSKGIKVVAKGGASAPWDSQFWIQIPTDVLDGALEFGEQVYISFDCRAEWDNEEVEEVNIGTQGHNAPGSYRNNTGVGTVTFTKEWTRHEAAMAPDANPYSIAFNLCEGQPDYDVTFYFDNITIQRVKKDEEKIWFWSPLVQNGDFETDNTNSFVVRIYQQGDSAPVIEEGIGVDDSRAIKVVIPAKKENDWDSQFFIKLDEDLPQGQAFKVSMDIKASETPANNPETQSHQTPGDYNFWSCIGTPTFTEEWTTYSTTVTVSSDMVSSGDKKFQAIAFNMARNDHEITYYFDNIDIRILKEGNKGDIPEIIELQQALDAAYSVYAEVGSAANAELRNAFTAAYEEAQQVVDNLDQENAVAARYALISAQSKFVASLNDYKSLESFIAWAEGKQAMAEAMGENYADLKDQIDAITGKLHDEVSAEAWTKAEISENTNKATIMSLISDYISKNVTDGDELTILLENPSFAGNTSGWQRDGGSKFLDYGPSNRNTLDMEDGKTGFLPTGMAEVWHGSFNAYQELTNLPAGLYTINVNACQRGDEDSEETAMIYALANGAETHKLVMSVYADPADEMLFDTDGIRADGSQNDGTWPSIENPNGEGWIPNGKGSANYHLNGGYYLNTFNVLLNGGGTLRIGIKDANTTNWVVMDNFKVIYHSMDNKLAIAAAIEGLIETAKAVQEGESDFTLTKPADDAIYNSIKIGENVVANIESTSLEDCTAAFDGLLAAIDDARANLKAVENCDALFYETFSGIFEENQETAMPSVIKAAEAAEAKYATVEDMTTEEILAYIDELNYLCDALLVPAEAAEADDANPVDLTEAILVLKGVDVDFEDYSGVGANKNYPGWSGSGFGTGGGTAGPVGERWNQSNGFNTYVDIAGLPAGTYVLSCDGAYRTNLNDDYARLSDETKTTDNEAFLYATTSKETAKVALHNIATGAITAEQCEENGIDNTANCGSVKKTVEVGTDEEGNAITETTTLYCPDQLYTADQWIQAGYYKDNKVVIVVPADGKLRIGVQRKGAANDWCFVDNFALNYYGADSKIVPTDIEGIAAPAVKAIYTISGLRVNNMTKPGLYISNGKKVLVK